MIQARSHNLRRRGRKFWTDSFAIDTESVPGFLSELSESILQCGKTLRLLKICSPKVISFRCIKLIFHRFNRERIKRLPNIYVTLESRMQCVFQCSTGSKGLPERVHAARTAAKMSGI